VVEIVANRLPRRFGLDATRDVQVLCPMHRGPAGAGVLNERLQAALTPAREGLAERRFGGRIYRVGDKVMQLRNNYDKGTAGVFNGSVGVVTALSVEDQELRVLLDEDEEVAYGFDKLDELTYAYAVSIHHAQGSEDPCVVIPVTTSAWRCCNATCSTRLWPGPNRSWSWSTASVPWPRQSGHRALAVATPPSPNGSSRDGRGPLRQSARLGDGQLQQVRVQPEERIRDRVRPAGRSG
jgi:hypothetical protein